MGSLVLLDLDGTLVDTAGEAFRDIKDGRIAPDTGRVPLIDGARELVADLKAGGHTPVIVSDSHPRYVQPVAKALFDIPALHLADKPNTSNTRQFLADNGLESYSPQQMVIVGDSWLDIHLARSLNCPSIFTSFYRGHPDARDGTGDTRRGVKAGAACVLNKPQQVLAAVEHPSRLYSAAEAVFAGHDGDRALPFKAQSRPGGYYVVRALGRQQSGECDARGIAKQYFQFCLEDRPADVVAQFAEAARRYLHRVVERGEPLDVLTHVADKTTTVPPDKLSAIAEAIDCGVPHRHLFEWSDAVDGSIRNRKKYADRSRFVSESLRLRPDADVDGKAVAVLDDQVTTGATADAVERMLRTRGARSVLFVALVCLVDSVPSEQACPRCGTRLQIKINRADGTRFLSCTPPLYRGNGCGNYNKNID